MTIETILWTNMPPHPQVKICSQCDEEFIRLRQGRNNKFCSKECVNQNRRNLQQEYKNPVRFTQLEGDGELDNGLLPLHIDPTMLAMADGEEDNRMVVDDARRVTAIIYEELLHAHPDVRKQAKARWIKRQKDIKKGNYQRWDAIYILGGWQRGKYDQ